MENKFYLFRSKGSLNTIAAFPDMIYREIEEHTLHNCKNKYILEWLMFNEYPKDLQFPVPFTVYDGRNYRDVIEMRKVCGFLISDRIFELFKESGLTGWKSYDVIVRDKKGNIVPGYHGFTVTEVTPTDVGPDTVIPDFFRPSPYYCTICSQKAKDVIKANKVKDFAVDLITPEDYDYAYAFIKHLI